MTWYLLVKWVHILSSTVLLGTGGGIAFFFVRAQRTGDPKVIAAVAGDAVLADTLFTRGRRRRQVRDSQRSIIDIIGGGLASGGRRSLVCWRFSI
jgi:hypothetical protein